MIWLCYSSHFKLVFHNYRTYSWEKTSENSCLVNPLTLIILMVTGRLSWWDWIKIRTRSEELTFLVRKLWLSPLRLLHNQTYWGLWQHVIITLSLSLSYNHILFVSLCLRDHTVISWKCSFLKTLTDESLLSRSHRRY